MMCTAKQRALACWLAPRRRCGQPANSAWKIASPAAARRRCGHFLGKVVCSPPSTPASAKSQRSSPRASVPLLRSCSRKVIARGRTGVVEVLLASLVSHSRSISVGPMPAAGMISPPANAATRLISLRSCCSRATSAGRSIGRVSGSARRQGQAPKPNQRMTQSPMTWRSRNLPTDFGSVRSRFLRGPFPASRTPRWSTTWKVAGLRCVTRAVRRQRCASARRAGVPRSGARCRRCWLPSSMPTVFT